MENRLKKIFIILIFVFVFGTLFTLNVNAASEYYYYNENGIVIEDGANLLKQEDIDELLVSMKKVREHGKVAFVTGYSTNEGYIDFAKRKCNQFFPNESATIFTIDMEDRKIYIYSTGKMYNSITSGKAIGITDNTYRLAKNEEYGLCAIETFEQIHSVLEHGFVFVPMRLVTGILFGVNVALLLGIIIVCRQKKMKFVVGDITNNPENFTLSRKVVLTKQEKHLHSSDSGGSGGGSGGGGGGGSSGGGGGHGF